MSSSAEVISAYAKIFSSNSACACPSLVLPELGLTPVAIRCLEGLCAQVNPEGFISESRHLSALYLKAQIRQSSVKVFLGAS
jgi:hypothetical protein